MVRFFLCLALAAVARPVAAQTSVPTDAIESITAADVSRHIYVIADDSMLGRDTPSRGLELTAQYVADQFKKFGLAPGGDSGTWFQRYPIANRPETAPNTVGVLEGSDPKLKDEYLVISAHMDHAGIKHGGTDSINNGASNNGSGTAGVLELAEALSRPGARPRRSVIFLAVSGNEKGLLGSRYFLKHTTVPTAQMVANFNLDGIGRNRGDTLLMLGKQLSNLDSLLDRVNAAHPELHLRVVDYDDYDERFFKLSDQAIFARAGVPSLCFTGIVNRDVDHVSDSPDKIDAEQEVRILRFALHAASEVANGAQRPAWKKKMRQTWP